MISAAGCQHTPMNLDHAAYERQVPNTDAVLLESDRRFVVMQFTNTRINGVIDSDSALAYVSFRGDPVHGIAYKDPGFALGWSSVAVVFSDMFKDRPGDPNLDVPGSWGAADDWEAGAQLIIRESLDRNDAYERLRPEGTGLPRRIEILDYASLLRESVYQVELAPPDPQNRLTD